MRVLGVDVSLGRGLDVVLLEDTMVKEKWNRTGPRALTELLWTHRPDAVAIDAPPKVGLGLLRDDTERARLPVPPPSGKHLARRVAEYELSRRGIGSHQTHYEEAKLFSWMTAGFEAFAAAREAGYALYLGPGRSRRMALEVFPYASYVALSGCLSPGRRWRSAWRRAVLAEAGVAGLPEIAGIVLPVHRLEDHYRRCAPPDTPLHAAGRVDTPRLCECGCGHPVRRRFLPGHDARLRSRLLVEARVGMRARKELARLGWKRALDSLDAEEE